MDFTHLINFNESLGFKFGIDAIFNADPNFLYIATATIFPPGNLYKNPPSYEHTYTFSNIDFLNSTQKYFRFTNFMQTIKDVPLAPDTSILIDIKAVKVINTKGVLSIQLTDFGWTACPIIEDLFFNQDHGYYVVSGNFVLQIFKGKVPSEILPDMKTNPLRATQLML